MFWGESSFSLCLYLTDGSITMINEKVEKTFDRSNDNYNVVKIRWMFKLVAIGTITNTQERQLSSKTISILSKCFLECGGIFAFISETDRWQ